MDKDRLFVVMPAYNEEANIGIVIREWMETLNTIEDEARLVVVNDGSKDNTYQVAFSMTAQYEKLIILDKSNSGHGSTVLYGYRYAIENGADYVFQTDSDGQTIPDELIPMWRARKEYDFQIGQRTGRQDGLSRVFVSSVLRMVVKHTFGVTIPDANTPFRLIERNALSTVMVRIPKDFFLSNVLVSVFLVKMNFNGRWTPVTFRNRQGGVNSINLKRITKIGMNALAEFREVKNSNADLFE